VASPGESRGRDANGLTRAAAALGAGLCAWSFEARADPYATVWATIFWGIATGCLACIVVELALGPGSWLRRAAVGIAFAFVNLFAYFIFAMMSIQVGVASGPSPTPSGYGPLIVATLVPWIFPVLRLTWLSYRKLGPKR